MRGIFAPLAVAAVVALAAPAHAQEAWPQRPVTIVVPFAAGGSADLLARILQQHLQAKFGVPFVVENKYKVQSKPLAVGFGADSLLPPVRSGADGRAVGSALNSAPKDINF